VYATALAYWYAFGYKACGMRFLRPNSWSYIQPQDHSNGLRPVRGMPGSVTAVVSMSAWSYHFAIESPHQTAILTNLHLETPMKCETLHKQKREVVRRGRALKLWYLLL
jgi:hypothetical protein